MYINYILIGLNVIHIITSLILIFILRKVSKDDVKTAITSTKKVLGNILKAFGITSISDATKAIDDIKEIFNKDKKE